MLGDPVIGWVRDQLAREMAAPPAEGRSDKVWRTLRQLNGWTQQQLADAIAEDADERARDAFFQGLGTSKWRSMDEPKWARRSVRGPDLDGLLAGLPFGAQGRGKPWRWWTGLEEQLALAWRLASTALNGEALADAQRVACTVRHLSDDPTGAVAASLAPVLGSGGVEVCSRLASSPKWWRWPTLWLGGTARTRPRGSRV